MIFSDEAKADKEAISRYIAKAGTDTIIRPGEIAKEVAMPIQDIYREIEDTHSDTVMPILEPYCPNCKEKIGKVFESFRMLPWKISCPHCGKTCRNFRKIADNTYVAYKVKANKERE